MRRLGIVLVVVLTASVAGDAVLRSYAESRAESELARRFDLTDPPSVELGGWPFVLGALRGRLGSVKLHADSFVESGVRIDDIDVVLEDVSFSLRQAIRGDLDSLRARSGSGTANLTERSLNEALAAADVRATVELRGEEVFVSIPELGGTARAELSVEGSVLVVRSEDGTQSFEVALPRFASGLSYEEVEVANSRALLRIHLRDATLRSPDR